MFTTASKEIEPAGQLPPLSHHPFKFTHFERQYENFTGKAGRVKYFIRAVLNRKMFPPLVYEKEFAVHQSGIGLQLSGNG